MPRVHAHMIYTPGVTGLEQAAACSPSYMAGVLPLPKLHCFYSLYSWASRMTCFCSVPSRVQLPSLPALPATEMTPEGEPVAAWLPSSGLAPSHTHHAAAASQMASWGI